MTANADQIAFWNETGGRRWTERQAQMDAVLAPMSAAALSAAAAQPGERVLDVGCGCGDTSLRLAEHVGPSGHVVGVDVSAVMLARARERAEGIAHLRFLEADASAAALPGPFDLLFSRFGVMFFEDPVAAFTHLRASIAPGGRLAFVCWRAFADNPWALVPTRAAMQALGVAPPSPDPEAPGPFAFASEARIRRILEGAGFGAITVTPFDAQMHLGDSLEAAVRQSFEIGPLARLLSEAPAGAEERVRAAVLAALQPHETSGGVALSGATWIVTARGA